MKFQEMTTKELKALKKDCQQAVDDGCFGTRDLKIIIACDMELKRREKKGE